MVTRWTVSKGVSAKVGFLFVGALLGCGESSSDGDDGARGGSGGSTATGGSGGSTATGGSGGSGGSTGGSGGSAGSGGAANDPCGGCAAQQMCIYQAGGPGPGHFLCASNPICRAVTCGCIEDQGTCMPPAPGNDMGVQCVCDNGLE